MLLFVGCRGPHLDDLYREELDQWQAQGAVDVRRAFSRVGSEDTEARGCKYVQDRLRHDSADVKRLWDDGARVYVCGSRHVGEAVKLAIGKILLGDVATEGQVGKWYEGVRNERYATDVFD
jgi:cytochrome P450/NADPH-cytochrome P450 reductase